MVQLYTPESIAAKAFYTQETHAASRRFVAFGHRSRAKTAVPIGLSPPESRKWGVASRRIDSRGYVSV